MSGKKLSLDEIKKLTDEELLQKLNLPSSVSLFPEQRHIAETWLADYGREPTTEELKFKAAIEMKAYEESEKKLIDKFVKLMQFEKSIQNGPAGDEDRKSVAEIYGEYHNKLGDRMFDYLKSEASKIIEGQDKSKDTTDENKQKKEKILANKEKKKIADNKLAQTRKKLAQRIDAVLGTHLEDKKLAKPLKKIEKAVSDKLLGKIKD